jgi:hypothetical protein
MSATFSVLGQSLRKRIERLEALIAVAFGSGGGGGGDLPLVGDVNGPEGANALTQIQALAGGGTRSVEVDNTGAVVAGSPGGPSTVVWRPGVASAGNVYATWAEIVAVVSKMNGDVTIGLDTDTAAATIPPGNYDLRPAGFSGPVTIVNASKAPPFGTPFFTLGPGAVTINGLTGLYDAQVDNQSTVPVITITSSSSFEMRQRAEIFQEPGAGAFWAVTGGDFDLFMADFAIVTTPGGGTPALTRTAPATIVLALEDTANFDNNMLTAAGGVTVIVSPTATYGTQAGAATIIPIKQRQSGSTAIAAGTGKTAAIPAFITATCKIIVSLKTPVGDALTVKYAALAADRNVGAPGSFQISALAAAGGGAVNGADTSTIDWEVISAP